MPSHARMRFALQVQPTQFIHFNMRKSAPPEIVDFMEGFMEFLAKRMVRELRKAVHRQTYRSKWKALSISWEMRKKSLRLDPRIWKASGELLESINWWHSKKDDCWYVGVHPRKRHHAYKMGGIYKSKKQKALIIDIIRWMEMGTRKMPPRPLFSPVLRDMKKAIPKLYQEYITSVKGRKGLQAALSSSGTMPNITASKAGAAKKTTKNVAKRATKKTAKKATKKVAKKATKKVAKKRSP